MLSIFGLALALTSTLGPSLVSAHGYVDTVVAGGHSYSANSPYEKDPVRPGWHAHNYNKGFIGFDRYHTKDISCHEDATPGKKYVNVQAGGSIQMKWTDWNPGHRGPVLTYLARCHNDDCTKQKPEDLDFFLIDSAGLLRPSRGHGDQGYWASGQLHDDNNSWTVKIPQGLSGNFVLRHEIIALHVAKDQKGKHGAQNYPNCINLHIEGSGNEDPCARGADCRKGTELYHASDPGILINIYYPKPKRYIIPGPEKWSGFD